MLSKPPFFEEQPEFKPNTTATTNSQHDSRWRFYAASIETAYEQLRDRFLALQKAHQKVLTESRQFRKAAEVALAIDNQAPNQHREALRDLQQENRKLRSELEQLKLRLPTMEYQNTQVFRSQEAQDVETWKEVARRLALKSNTPLNEVNELFAEVEDMIIESGPPPVQIWLALG